jgi:hypothetical protein
MPRSRPPTRREAAQGSSICLRAGPAAQASRKPPSSRRRSTRPGRLDAIQNGGVAARAAADAQKQVAQTRSSDPGEHEGRGTLAAKNGNLTPR